MDYLKKNSSLLISIFLLISPIIDFITRSKFLSTNFFSVGILIRGLFLISIIFISITYKKKKIVIPYFIIIIYFIFYILVGYFYKDSFSLLKDIHGLIRSFYFPILFLSLYLIREELRISKYTLWITICIYTLLLYKTISN